MLFAEADWFGVADRYGVLGIILFLLTAGAVLLFRIVWKDIVLPIRDRVITRLNAFFDRMETVLGSVGAFHKGHEDSLQRIEDWVKRVDDGVQEVHDTCLRMEAHALQKPPPAPRARSRISRVEMPPPATQP